MGFFRPIEQKVRAIIPQFFPDVSSYKNTNKKTSHKWLVFNMFLVGTRGFEPPTPDTL